MFYGLTIHENLHFLIRFSSYIRTMDFRSPGGSLFDDHAYICKYKWIDRLLRVIYTNI